ncbi:MAG: hypothetical protein AAF570_02360 [Bacteroidota bacterium]
MSNLSDIGFQVSGIDDFRALAEMVYYKGTGFRAGESFYVRYHDASGAELWLQIDAHKKVVGMNPHFAGSLRRSVQVTDAISRSESPMDGAFAGRFPFQTPGSSDVQWKEFIFDMPDAYLLPSLRLPATVDLELSGFASQIECYPTAEVPSLGNEAYAFDGSTFSMVTDKGPNEAHASISGIVRAQDTRENRQSGRSFYWMKVETLGGELDLVADPAICNQPPVIGGVVAGTFWLSGRVHVPDDLKPRKGFLERLFWGS